MRKYWKGWVCLVYRIWNILINFKDVKKYMVSKVKLIALYLCEYGRRYSKEIGQMVLKPVRLIRNSRELLREGAMWKSHGRFPMCRTSTCCEGLGNTLSHGAGCLQPWGPVVSMMQWLSRDTQEWDLRGDDPSQHFLMWKKAAGAQPSWKVTPRSLS